MENLTSVFEKNLNPDTQRDSPYYWTSNNQAEVDFLIQIEENVVPLEVKSANNVRARSLGLYRDKYEPAYAIRVSTKNFGFENGIKSIPLYALFTIS